MELGGSMSVDKSLKIQGKLARPKNVFKRIERIKMLTEEGKWNPTMSVYGIPKVKSVKQKRKVKEKKPEKVAEGVAAEAATAAATEAKPAAATPAATKEKAKK